MQHSNILRMAGNIAAAIAGRPDVVPATNIHIFNRAQIEEVATYSYELAKALIRLDEMERPTTPVAHHPV